MPEHLKPLGSEHSPPSSPSTATSSRFTHRTGSHGASEMSRTTVTSQGSTTPLINSSVNTPQTFGPASLFQQARDNQQGDSVEGWPLLAKLMAEEPNFEAFPRYQELNIKNLLYCQVELAVIWNNLKLAENQDWESTLGPRMLAGEKQHHFHRVAYEMFDTESEQWEEVLKLRKCLSEYNNALLQYSQVSALPSPSRRNMKELVRWLVSPGAGNFKIIGLGSEAWGNMYEQPVAEPSLSRQFWNLLLSIIKSSDIPTTRPDLVAPRSRKLMDGMTWWITEELIPFWVNFKDRKKKENKNDNGDIEKPKPHSEHIGIQRAEEKKRMEKLKELKLKYSTSYSGSSLLRFTANLTTLFASMLPMAAIGVLSTVEKLSDKLALIASFTAVFCAGLMILTDITRVQVFSATSAFLAVLVVFVQQGSEECSPDKPR